MLLPCLLLALPARADRVVYTDALRPDWSADDSWGVRSLEESDDYGGNVALHAWLHPDGAVWLNGPAFTGAVTLDFTMLADSPDLEIHIVDADGTSLGSELLSDHGSTVPWGYASFEIPLRSVSHGAGQGIQLRSLSSGGDEFWIDDIVLVGAELDSGGTTDGGATDGGTTDGGTSDGGSTDGGTSDGGSTDGGTTDGGSTDGGTTDGGSTDGGTTDGGTSDGGGTDADTPEDGGTDKGCSTVTATPLQGGLALLAVGLLCLRRRPVATAQP